MSGFVFFLDASPSPAYNPRHPRVVSVLVEYEGIETNNLIEKDALGGSIHRPNSPKSLGICDEERWQLPITNQ